MKICTNCGVKNDAWEANCVRCKAPFVEGVDPPVEEARAQSETTYQAAARPTGEDTILLGGIALVLGLIALAFGWFLPAAEYSYSGIDPERLQLKANLMVVGGVLANSGALAYFAGQIINAISYLPGRGER